MDITQNIIDKIKEDHNNKLEVRQSCNFGIKDKGCAILKDSNNNLSNTDNNVENIIKEAVKSSNKPQ